MIPIFHFTPLLMPTLEPETILLTWTDYWTDLPHHPESLSTYPLVHDPHLSLLLAQCATDMVIPRLNAFGMAQESALIAKKLDTCNTLATYYNAIVNDSILTFFIV